MSEYEKKRDGAALKASDQVHTIFQGDYIKGFEAGSDFGREYQRGVESQILKVCEGNTEFMWAAKIVGIILNCDFREAKQALEAYNKSKDVKP